METPEGYVRRNARQLREDRKHTVRSLSARLGELGRPILPSGITKIEDGSRRVDVGDLVALAVALGTTPNRLMLPAASAEGQVALTPTDTGSPVTAVYADTAWDWALGSSPLPSLDREPTVEALESAYDDFRRHAWPVSERLAREHPAARAATRVASRLRDVLRGRTEPQYKEALRKALARLVDEVEDVLGSDDGER